MQQVLVIDSARGDRRRLLLLAAAAAAALVVLLLWLLTLGPRYVLVIDAGSSGTRMYAYTWRSGRGSDSAPRLAVVPSSAAAHKVPRRALPSKRAYQRVETEPGLDRFAGTDVAGLQDRALGACSTRHTEFSEKEAVLAGWQCRLWLLAVLLFPPCQHRSFRHARPARNSAIARQLLMLLLLFAHHPPAPPACRAPAGVG